LKEITVYINARKNSVRCKNKLCRKFANTTLIDIAIKKLCQIQEFYPVIFAAYENELLDKAVKNLPIFKRTKESSESEDTVKLVFEVLKYIPTEYVAFMNPCCPFMKIKTILKALRHFQNNKNSKSLSCVHKTRDWYFLQNNYSVIPMTTISTKTCDYLWEVSQTLNIYPRERFYYDEIEWKGIPNDPELFEIDRTESMDIDFENEFYACEYIYKNENFII